jgi:HEPN domain-containing protein
VLIYLQVEFPFTHNLNVLWDRIPDDWAVKYVQANLARLSEYAVDVRYPGKLARPFAR